VQTCKQEQLWASLIRKYFLKCFPFTDKQQENSSDTRNSSLADPLVVNRDHSYCKQVSLLKKPSVFADESAEGDYSASGKKTRLSLATSASEELIDRLVGDRLSRIFDGHIKAEKVDVCGSQIDDSVDQCEGELIDAGLDLTPDDLQKLPDLSYEE